MTGMHYRGNTRGAIEIPHGTRGFDCNAVVSYETARKFMSAGYRFSIRYVPRIMAKPSDLSAHEVDDLHRAGLAVMPVQHVERDSPPWWVPSLQKGEQYGRMAAAHAQACGIALGTCVWLDLEGIDHAVPASIVTQYANRWYDEVAQVGYTPGLYVGYSAIIPPHDLYYRLRFEHYWAAYNLNRDQEPAVRGVQMRQGAAKHADLPPGVAFPIDTDLVMHDHVGGLPIADAPAEWDIPSA
jgi:hypothetical protein